MSISDESFREAFKPLHIPAHYNDADSDEDKIIYSLAQLGEGTAPQVAAKLLETDSELDVGRYEVLAQSVLNGLFDKGLIKGVLANGEMSYNLSKITKANKGNVNPHLLAPGLD